MPYILFKKYFWKLLIGAILIDLSLKGIPLGIKDLFCTSDMPTTAGSKILSNFQPTYDSFVTNKLLNKGSKHKAFDQAALPAPGKVKSKSLAEYPKTLEKIAKQIKADHGITLNVKRTKMFNEPSAANRPYQIVNNEGELIASFKTKANRDYILDKKNAGHSQRGTVDFQQRFEAKDITAGPKSDKEAFWAYTLEIPENAAKQLLKKKMRSYRIGGLVAIQPKREYFAPIF